MAVKIERRYGWPMYIEWTRNGGNGKLYIVQARPETVAAQNHQQRGARGGSLWCRRPVLAACVSHELRDLICRSVSEAAAITNCGGRTCHAAIMAHKLGIPAIVGCGDATDKIKEGDVVTVFCAEGDTGYIYKFKKNA
ncbi:ppsA [Symbiodinium natans]|uniref:PpsA protein n=1 Tax=Symbiodinium natans TaxID=878477 RepID=A0A812RFC5_9DINO|nr:ppsA [Symbiodinium natans]